MQISIFKAGAIACCCVGLLIPLGCSSQEDVQAKLDAEAEVAGANSIASRDMAAEEPNDELQEEEEIYFPQAPVHEQLMEPQEEEESVSASKSPTEVGQPLAQIETTGPSAPQNEKVPTGFVGEARAVVDNSPAQNVPKGQIGDARGRAAKPTAPDALAKQEYTFEGSSTTTLDQSKRDIPRPHLGRVGFASGRQQDGGILPQGSVANASVDAEAKPREHQLDAFGGAEQAQPSREAYDHIEESPFRQVSDHPLSTFSIDVDTASYSNMRRFLTGGRLPPAGAVRIEELINYFTYDYPEPKGDEPFSTDIEIAAAPWNEEHRLVRVGLQGKKLHAEQRPDCNLVFLIDTSGSMRSSNKLPLVMQSMLLLAEQLEKRDSVAIVTYAGSAGVRLPATTGDNYEEIGSAIHGLSAGGSTNGAGGITLAYQIAREHLIKDGVNRVILATDGDFNVGITNQSELTKLIETEAKSGVFLSVLGYGMGNYNDSTLEKLADKGNGNYAYIDTIKEANKVLSEQLFGTLVTIAKDVKIQVEFNPAKVSAYRLIGYENRMLKKEDFNNDKKDAGEIGAGHTVTALYEVVPVGVEVPTPKVDPLKYQQEKSAPAKLSKAAKTDEMLTLKLRYKAPDGDKSKLLEFPVKDSGHAFGKSSQDFQFATSVASFGMKLRGSETVEQLSLGGILEIAQSAVGEDENGYRGEFVELVKKSQQFLK